MEMGSCCSLEQCFDNKKGLQIFWKSSLVIKRNFNTELLVEIEKILRPKMVWHLRC